MLSWSFPYKYCIKLLQYYLFFHVDNVIISISKIIPVLFLGIEFIVGFDQPKYFANRQINLVQAQLVIQGSLRSSVLVRVETSDGTATGKLISMFMWKEV